MMSVDDYRDLCRNSLEENGLNFTATVEIDLLNLKFLLNEVLELHHKIIPKLQSQIRSSTAGRICGHANADFIASHLEINRTKKVQ